jgi:integrase
VPGYASKEVLALAQNDLDPRRGALLVRRGKGGRRREVGMDDWGWEQLRRWLAARAERPAGPLFCIIDGRTRGRAWSAAAARTEFRRLAVRAAHVTSPTGPSCPPPTGCCPSPVRADDPG